MEIISYQWIFFQHSLSAFCLMLTNRWSWRRISVDQVSPKFALKIHLTKSRKKPGFRMWNPVFREKSIWNPKVLRINSYKNHWKTQWENPFHFMNRIFKSNNHLEKQKIRVTSRLIHLDNSSMSMWLCSTWWYQIPKNRLTWQSNSEKSKGIGGYKSGFPHLSHSKNPPWNQQIEPEEW